jgi:hypothetical protein
MTDQEQPDQNKRPLSIDEAMELLGAETVCSRRFVITGGVGALFLGLLGVKPTKELSMQPKTQSED